MMLFEILSFLLVNAKKVISFNSPREIRLLLKTGPITIFIPDFANSFADLKAISGLDPVSFELS